MTTFGARSKVHLKEAHPYLRAVLEEAIKIYDFTIICGYRGRAEQELAYRKGNSKARFGKSPHNYKPCVAVDCIPYPFSDKDWKNRTKFKSMWDNFSRAADKCRANGKVPANVRFRWGGDWHMDGNRTKNDAWDQPHIELHPWQNYVDRA